MNNGICSFLIAIASKGGQLLFLWVVLLCGWVVLEGCSVLVGLEPFSEGDTAERAGAEVSPGDAGVREPRPMIDLGPSENTKRGEIPEVPVLERTKEAELGEENKRPQGVGGGCQEDIDCGEGADVCIKDDQPPAAPFPFSRGPRGGYCSVKCEIGRPNCPNNGACFIPGDIAGVCLKTCNTDVDCRVAEGYRCHPLRDKVVGGTVSERVCVPPNDRCHVAHFVGLKTGSVTINDSTVQARNEFPALTCGSKQVGSGLKKGQLYYWAYHSGKKILFTFTPKTFDGFVYVFSKSGNHCEFSNIQKDCSSLGVNGMISNSAKAGQSIQFSFQTRDGSSMVFAVGSSTGVGSFTLKLETQ